MNETSETNETPAPRRNPPPREWARARRLYEDGQEPVEIAQALGVTASAVRLRRRHEDWTRAAPHAPPRDMAAPPGPATAADTMRRAAQLLDESARAAARRGDSARAAAEAEKLARLEKLIDESDNRAIRRAPALPAAESKAMREALQRNLNLALRAWVRESLRAMLRRDFMDTDSREALAEALQARIDTLGEAGADPDFAGWPVRIGDVQRMGAGFWNNRYTTDDRALIDKLEALARSRDPNRLLFGLIDGHCILHPWQRAPE